MNNKKHAESTTPFWSLVVLLFIAIIVSGCQSSSDSTTNKPKAVFIIIDGIPADVIESVSTPALDEISQAGGYTRAYVGGTLGAESESPTVSAVGYMSLITGTWSNKHNVRDNEVDNPNYRYWDIFRIAKSHDPSLRTAIFSTWEDNRTKLIGDGLESAGGNKLDYHFDGLELDAERFPPDEKGDYIRAIDDLVAADAARYIGENGPDLSWVYLQHTDDIGHYYGDSPEQIEAVGQMDQRVGTIWNAVKARMANYSEDWLIVVTTDHGRNAETGKDHGNQTARERTIWIATNSDRLSSRFNEMPGIVDILPSIAVHLQLEMPASIREQLDGQSFIE